MEKMKKQLISIMVFFTLVITGFAIIPLTTAVSNTVDKTFSVDHGELGDVVTVTVDITVAPDYSAHFEDWLPLELKYIGNFKIDTIPTTPSNYEDHKVEYKWLTEGTYTIEFDVKIVEATSWESLEVYNLGWVYWWYDAAHESTTSLSEMFTIDPFEELEKYVDEPLEAEVGVETHWTMHIELNDVPIDMTDVLIKDRFGGDLGVTEIDKDIGITDYYTKGKTEKVFLEWDIGNLVVDDDAYLILDVYTDINTGTGNGKKAGHREYTSSGEHFLNSGATLKFLDGAGDQLSVYTDSIAVWAS
jgi:hypothetical protein